ncbi:hypothetical protein ALP86_01681 [Pseudomonas amygdali pv. mori]|uniref:Uncharacterized protein n=1 Tax=Pseudomonas amygdali pv. mori TaxID=34065 RepID=A0A3M4UYG3_PSEA0|nr:hypothetical protein ALQ05_02205 [Pseudomonas amygdali pv. mori]RMR44527.1 hypothetical protein ALP86_01681 [Pseudomonas amygdali pv. mori]
MLIMVDSKTTLTPEQSKAARIAYRLARSLRGMDLKAVLAVAQVANIVDPTDGTLNKDVLLGTSLDVTLAQWAQLVTDDGQSDTFFIDWAVGEVPADDGFLEVFTDTVTAPVAVGTFPKLINIPLTALTSGFPKPADGVYSLRYRIRQPNDQETISPLLKLIVDTTPPGGQSEPGSMALATVQLTQEFLDNNLDGLVGTLPDYGDWQAGDKVAFYWVSGVLPVDPVELPSPIGFVGVDNAMNNTVTFPVSAIEGSKDEAYYVAYFLFDKATNRSRLSAYTRIDVALGLLPDNLKDPLVPLAFPPDNLINLPDARMGVEVLIESFDNWKPTDRIEVTWGTAVLWPEYMGEVPQFPFSVRVPDTVLRDQYAQVTGGDQPTTVSYQVLRGVVPSAVKSISVNVNFSTIGPDPVPDPDWPDPVNDQLLPVEVYGEVSNELNVLTPEDDKTNASVIFKLYDPLLPGEVVDFYWGASHVPEVQYTVVDTDKAGDEREVEIPWRYIEFEGNRPDLPVHYSIRAADSENTQQSPDTPVNVSAVVITPDAPEFQGTSPGGWLNCTSLYKDPANPSSGEPGVRVVVPDLSNYLAAGDTVTLYWNAFPSDPQDDTPISGVEKTEHIVLGDDYPVTGFTWLVTPYETHLLPTYDLAGHGINARGKIKYSFSLKGSTITSLETTAEVGMYDANGACPIV